MMATSTAIMQMVTENSEQQHEAFPYVAAVSQSPELLAQPDCENNRKIVYLIKNDGNLCTTLYDVHTQLVKQILTTQENGFVCYYSTLYTV